MLRIILVTISILFSGLLTFVQAQTDEFNLDETYSINPEGTINLKSDDADVRISGSNRDDVRVIVHYKLTVRGLTFGESNKFEMVVEERNGNLMIREAERDFGSRTMIGFSSEEYTIEIETPRNVNLDIEGDDEEYEISGIDGSIHLQADDSDAKIWDIKGRDFSFSVDDGSIDMNGGSGRLRISADDGDVRIKDGNFEEIDADSDDSDIEITTSLFDDGVYRFDLDDADLTLNITGGGGEFDIRHDDSDINTSGEFEPMRDDENSARYKLRGGNARIVIRADDGDINLRVY